MLENEAFLCDIKGRCQRVDCRAIKAFNAQCATDMSKCKNPYCKGKTVVYYVTKDEKLQRIINQLHGAEIKFDLKQVRAESDFAQQLIRYSGWGHLPILLLNGRFIAMGILLDEMIATKTIFRLL